MPARPTNLLDNIFWHCLIGPHAPFATGAGAARRYAPGFSPIVGFADADAPDLAALLPYCSQGEQFYCDRWSGAAAAGWRIDQEATMIRMVWDGAVPPQDPAGDAVPLTSLHAVQALELARLTRPGPFGPRTLELGQYVGYFDDGALIAMAGERMCAEGLREISGICTHPAYQGRGMARRLALKLVRNALLRGELPFLHVLSSNAVAHDLYLRMGFRDYCENVVRVISPL